MLLRAPVFADVFVLADDLHEMLLEMRARVEQHLIKQPTDHVWTIQEPIERAAE
jgi:hypothetical protein